MITDKGVLMSHARIAKMSMVSRVVTLVILMANPFAHGAEATPVPPAPPLRNVGLDYNASLGFRTLPIASFLSVDAGYSMPVWGDWATKSNFKYGYLRPAVRLISAVIVNAVDARVTFRPISFIGLTAGAMQMSRFRDKVNNVNCDITECRGDLRSTYSQFDLALASGDFFLVGQSELKDYSSQRNVAPFYEDIAAVIGAQGSDRLVSHGYSVGIRPNIEKLPNGFVALSIRQTKMQNSESTSERLGLAVGHQYQDYKLTYFLGTYQSSLEKAGPTAAIAVEWIGIPGLAL